MSKEKFFAEKNIPIKGMDIYFGKENHFHSIEELEKNKNKK